MTPEVGSTVVVVVIVVVAVVVAALVVVEIGESAALVVVEIGESTNKKHPMNVLIKEIFPSPLVTMIVGIDFLVMPCHLHSECM